MSKRGSRSAVFIGEIKKYVQKYTFPKIKPNINAPKNFNAKINFYPKEIINSKNNNDLIAYVQRLKKEYELLTLTIKKPDKAKIFKRVDYKKLSTMRKAVLDIQSKIRQIEIINFIKEQNKS